MRSQNKMQAISSQKSELSSRNHKKNYNQKEYDNQEARVVNLEMVKLVGLTCAYVFHQFHFRHRTLMQKDPKKFQQDDFWFELPVSYISQQTGLEKRMIFNAIENLRIYNILLIQKTNGRSNLYKITNQRNWCTDITDNQSHFRTGFDTRNDTKKCKTSTGSVPPTSTGGGLVTSTGGVPVAVREAYWSANCENNLASAEDSGSFSDPLLKVLKGNTFKGKNFLRMDANEFASVSGSQNVNLENNLRGNTPQTETEDDTPNPATLEMVHIPQTRSKRTSVPGQIKSKYAQMETQVSLAQSNGLNLSDKFTREEIRYAKSYFVYVKDKFPNATRRYEWTNCAPEWCAMLKRITRGRKATYTFEEVTGALEWAKTSRFYHDKFRSLSRLTKIWKDDVRAIDHLMEAYKEAKGEIVRANADSIKDTVERALMAVDCPKNDFDTELENITDSLAQVQEWLDTCNAELPAGVRNYWYQSVEFLQKCEEFTRVRFEFDDWDDFIDAAIRWQDDIEKVLNNAVKRNKLTKFSGWFVQPEQILNWR